MTTTIHDLRFAVRGFTRTPGVTLLVLATLGIGTGASTAIFSAVNQVILRPLPFGDPERLVMLWESNAERGWDRVHAAPANVLDWRERVAAFQDVALVSDFTSGVALSGRGDPVQVTISPLSGNTFAVLGVTPLLGRFFTFEETWADAEPLVVLGYDAWRRYFGADSGVVDRTIRLDGIAYRVIGVTRPWFEYGVSDAELWTTFRWTPQRRASVWFRQAHVVRAIARLRPGVTHEQARAELETVARQLQAEYPETNRSMEAGLTPLHRYLVGDQRTPLLLLLGAVGVLLLIACANVANLFLARAVTRRQEMAVRSALGAGRARIVRQVLTESLVIAVVGTGVGVSVGVLGFDWIAALRPPELPDLAFRVDWRLLGFTVGVAALSAVAFGTLPAVRSARMDVRDQLADGSRAGTPGRRSFVAANGLVSLEIGLAVMLVVAAGLMIRSLAELRRVDPGIDPRNILTFQVRPPSGRYPTDGARAAFAARFIERLRGVPGVGEVGAGRKLPFVGFGWTSDFAIEGSGPGEYGTDVRHREATPGYFRALGVRVLDGSLFEETIGPNEQIPVVVNQAFVDRFSPDESPVGRRIAFDRIPDSTSYWYPIVGVVTNERMSITSDPQPEIIAHLVGDTPDEFRFVIKTAVPPLSIVPAIRAALGELDPEIPLMQIRTMDDVAADAIASDRFLLTLLSIFAAVALTLAAVGVYGVAAQAARARTREIGIRMALGASSGDITRTLIARGLSFVGLGVILGLLGATVAGGAIRTLLFGVEPDDPLTLVAVAVLLTLVAVGAILLPVRQASRLDPARVLSAE